MADQSSSNYASQMPINSGPRNYHSHSTTVTQILDDSKKYFKSMVLRLRTRKTKEECEQELHRIVSDLKMDVSRNIDAITHRVIEMRPMTSAPNYDQAIRLYDSILDQVTRIIEDLDRTFEGIFHEFNQYIEELWIAISRDREGELKVAQENFRTILNRYSVQWNRSFEQANRTVHNLEEQLAQQTERPNVIRKQYPKQ